MPAIAKTDRLTGHVRSLIGHALDVAQSAHAMLTNGVLRERLGNAAGTPINTVIAARLAVLIGLHDFGKALNGFQDRIRGTFGGRGHVAEALAAIAADISGLSERLQAVLALDDLSTWFDDPGEAFYSVVCHHGGPVAQARIEACFATTRADLMPQGEYDPIEELACLTSALLSTFPQALRAGPRISCTPRFLHALAGLAMTADWMGSDSKWFPLSGPENRPEAAKMLLTDTGWSGWHSGAKAEAILCGRQPRSAQVVVLDLPLTHRLVTLEAPTGTGKTEAALIWTARLAEAGLVDGLFFAVPTRSAATELHARISRLMADSHPLLAGRIVRAVPGQIDTDQPVAMFDEDRIATWALGGSRRTMAAPIAVGTIDQAMLSQMKVRHAHLRWNCLCRHLLVIDEVHASDPYMSEIISRLVSEHLTAGSYALLMSATLGESMQARLMKRPRQTFGEAMSRQYPLIAAAGFSEAVPVTESRAVRVAVKPHENALATAAEAARTGLAVLLIRSTVTDALADFSTLRGAGVETLLHHSRYADVDRQFLDRSLLAVLGLNGTRRGMVVVATQTAEQSLDIDADLLVTDACPADVLLQRMGRLQRHRFSTEPLCIVIDPGQWDRYVAGNGSAIGQKDQGWSWVYNPLSVRETLTWIAKAGLVRVPEDVRALVEVATHPDHLEYRAKEHGAAWVALWQRLYRNDSHDRALGVAVLVERSLPYSEALVDPDAATRRGDSSINVAVTNLISPFTYVPIEVLPIPAQWLIGVEPGSKGVSSRDGDTGNYVVQVGPRRFSYSREGLQRAAPGG